MTKLKRSQEGEIKKSPTLEHSPGEAACSNVERSIDSSAQGGDKACKGGGGCIAISREGR